MHLSSLIGGLFVAEPLFNLVYAFLLAVLGELLFDGGGNAAHSSILCLKQPL